MEEIDAMLVCNNINLLNNPDCTKTKWNRHIGAAAFFSVSFHVVSGIFLLKMIESMASPIVVRPIEITIVSPTTSEQKILVPPPMPPPVSPPEMRPLPDKPLPPVTRIIDQPRTSQEIKRIEPASAPVAVAPTATANTPTTLYTSPVASAPVTAKPSHVISQPAPTTGSVAAQNPSGPVIGPSFDAGYLNNPAPPYPAIARRMKLQGTAVVRVLVSTEGNPQHVALEKSSGSRILDDAAMEAVKGWRFVPARRGAEHISALVDVPVRFHLN